MLLEDRRYIFYGLVALGHKRLYTIDLGFAECALPIVVCSRDRWAHYKNAVFCYFIYY